MIIAKMPVVNQARRVAMIIAKMPVVNQARKVAMIIAKMPVVNQARRAVMIIAKIQRPTNHSSPIRCPSSRNAKVGSGVSKENSGFGRTEKINLAKSICRRIEN
ncbi:MAG: hypothetical protein JJT94_10530 [Bernardetiaceae bacterium]|nr:hypothetical protein [Bernardetiaceae bacterium]